MPNNYAITGKIASPLLSTKRQLNQPRVRNLRSMPRSLSYAKSVSVGIGTRATPPAAARPTEGRLYPN